MTQADSVHSTPPLNTSATTLLERPAESAGARYRRTDISSEQFFQTLGRVRRAARDEIERLIDWLDSTIDDGPCDGDPDAEPIQGSAFAIRQIGRSTPPTSRPRCSGAGCLSASSSGTRARRSYRSDELAARPRPRGEPCAGADR